MVEPTPAPTKPSYRERFNHLLAEWGSLVLWVYFSIFAIVLVGFVVAIKLGFGVEGAAGTAGTLGAAYVATKLTQPLRIAATLVLTPALAALLKRARKRRASIPAPAPVEPSAADGSLDSKEAAKP